MIKIKNLVKNYKLTDDNIVQALKGVDLQIEREKVIGLIGPSGSGKSSLLNILGGLDRKYDGEVTVDGKDLKNYNLNIYRRKIVQTVFQQFYLVPSLSVEENVLLPIKFGRQYKGSALKERVEYIIEKVGLTDRKHHRPNQLSGGQAQRVAIARALIAGPKIILADEPTGNLDTKTSKDILNLLMSLNEDEKITMIIITHDIAVIKDLDQKIYLQDGKIVDQLSY
jgi:ABC-type lipoprotein export system ATPase subunit